MPMGLRHAVAVAQCATDGLQPSRRVGAILHR
jgi:hypothetical protein